MLVAAQAVVTIMAAITLVDSSVIAAAVDDNLWCDRTTYETGRGDIVVQIDVGFDNCRGPEVFFAVIAAIQFVCELIALGTIVTNHLIGAWAFKSLVPLIMFAIPSGAFAMTWSSDSWARVVADPTRYPKGDLVAKMVDWVNGHVGYAFDMTGIAFTVVFKMIVVYMLAPNLFGTISAYRGILAALKQKTADNTIAIPSVVIHAGDTAASLIAAVAFGIVVQLTDRYYCLIGVVGVGFIYARSYYPRSKIRWRRWLGWFSVWCLVVVPAFDAMDAIDGVLTAIGFNFNYFQWLLVINVLIARALATRAFVAMFDSHQDTPAFVALVEQPPRRHKENLV